MLDVLLDLNKNRLSMLHADNICAILDSYAFEIDICLREVW